MNILVTAFLFLLGLLLIIKGGDIFVEAAGWLSDVTSISRVVIGATVVSLATTSPEYFVSLIAVLKGANELSIGNAVGSLIANLGLAFALLAISTPGKVHDAGYGKKGAVMIVATTLLFIFCLNGMVSILEGAILFAVFILFTVINIYSSKKDEEKHERKPTTRKEIAVNVSKFIVGAIGIILGSSLIVDHGQVLAAAMGVSEAVIGLTFVAIGTSLPEIVTSITAIVKKESDLSIGNIIGANTIDATLILASSSVVSGGRLSVLPEIVRVEIPLAILLMVVAVVPSAIGKKIYRWQGILMGALYFVYLVYLMLFRI